MERGAPFRLDRRVVASLLAMSQDKKAKRWVLRGLLVGAGLVAGAAMAEIGFSVAHEGAFPHLNLYREDQVLGARLVPGASMTLKVGSNPVTRVRVNGEGYRGEEWPERSEGEVLIVGDSQVFGLGVEEGETFSARLAELLGKTVINAGVPTYGPEEYRQVLREVGAKRRPAHVVLTLNMVNDVLESGHPNSDRHAIWDGWAVRKETAPPKSDNFPGKSFLFNRSHAVFALRKYLHQQRAEDITQHRLPSEGVFSDLVATSVETKSARRAASEETRKKRAATLESERELRKKQAELDRKAVLALSDLGAGDYIHVIDPEGYDGGVIDVTTQLSSARANPGDIVGEVSYGESSGPYAATAHVIRHGARLRSQLEDLARRRAAARPDDAKAKAALEKLAGVEELDEQLARLLAQPPERVFAWSPLKKEIEETKKLVDEMGAELTVLVLPIDVQVSEKEWEKYGEKPLDMTDSLVLNDDAVRAAKVLGARAVHPLNELRDAEPGAFLHGDLHLTKKGHQVVAEALSKALRAPRALPEPGAGLPEGRTRAPAPSALAIEAVVKGSTAAGCKTFYRDGWFRAVCSPTPGKNESLPHDVRLMGGRAAEVEAFRVGQDLAFTLPFSSGDSVKGKIIWQDHVRPIDFAWPKGQAEYAITIGEPTPLGAKGAGAATVQPTNKVCACAEKSAKELLKSRRAPADSVPAPPDPPFSCVEHLLTSHPGCEKYSDSCEELLACHNGDPWFRPECPEGEANVGVLPHCRPLCDPKSQPCGSGMSCEAWQGAHACFPSGE
jgi:hypothetical protein